MKKSTINVIIAAIAAIVLGCVLVSGFQDRNKAMNSITVTGMSQKDFTSDLIVWQGSYTIRNFNLAEGYKKLHGDAETVKNYLLSQGLKPEEFVFSSVNFYKDFSNSYNRQTGESTSVFNGYVLSQNVQITSKDVNKIEALSRDVTSLINKGIEFSSDAPEYYYTKLSDFHAQFRYIGTNYNQVVKELRIHFSEKKAMALLYKLEKCTIDLVKLSREIVELSREMEKCYQSKSD